MGDDSAERLMPLDRDSLRRVIRKSVVERRIAGRDRRQQARLLALESTEPDEINPDILDWIVRK